MPWRRRWPHCDRRWARLLGSAHRIRLWGRGRLAAPPSPAREKGGRMSSAEKFSLVSRAEMPAAPRSSGRRRSALTSAVIATLGTDQVVAVPVEGCSRHERHAVVQAARRAASLNGMRPRQRLSPDRQTLYLWAEPREGADHD